MCTDFFLTRVIQLYRKFIFDCWENLIIDMEKYRLLAENSQKIACTV